MMIRVRPRKLRLIIGIILAALFAFAATILITGPDVASAQPRPGCQGGYTPWGGGEYCDMDFWDDGSYLNCHRVIVMGFGGTNCNRVCPPVDGQPPVPTDWDIATRC